MNTDPKENKSEELNESELDSVTGGAGNYGHNPEDDAVPEESHPGEEKYNEDGDSIQYDSDGNVV